MAIYNSLLDETEIVSFTGDIEGSVKIGAPVKGRSYAAWSTPKISRSFLLGYSFWTHGCTASDLMSGQFSCAVCRNSAVRLSRGK